MDIVLRETRAAKVSSEASPAIVSFVKMVYPTVESFGQSYAERRKNLLDRIFTRAIRITGTIFFFASASFGIFTRFRGADLGAIRTGQPDALSWDVQACLWS